MSGIPWDATTVTSHGDGCYSATIGEEWVLAMAPQGGVVAAIAARAMAAELHAAEGAGQALRSIHGVFVTPVPAGEVVVDVEVLRRGRSISQARATVRGEGSATGFTALAVFGAGREGFSFVEASYPPVPDPEAQPSFRDPLPPEAVAGAPARGPMPFWEQVIEGRIALGHVFWDPTPRTRAHAANWYRFDHEPIGPDGRLDPYALFVFADVMPNAVFERMGPTARQLFAPSADLTVHLFGAPSPGWVLAEYRAHLAHEGYSSVEAHIWDPRGPEGPELVAYATQQMFFTPFV